MRQQRRHVAQLRGLGLQELAPRGRIEEQVADLEARPGGPRHFLYVAQSSAREFDAGPGAFRGLPGLEHQARDGGDRRQRLAAKAQRRNLEQVFCRANLAGGVALEGEQSVIVGHAAAVVGHPDQALAARLDGHFNAPGAGVNGVLDQLLHHRRRPLHHLAGGDFVGDGFG